LNDQICTGTKAELLERIGDCVKNGCLPRCPKCFLGRLKTKDENKFYCPGAYDDDSYQPCHWKGDQSNVVRTPWKKENLNDPI